MRDLDAARHPLRDPRRRPDHPRPAGRPRPPPHGPRRQGHAGRRRRRLRDLRQGRRLLLDELRPEHQPSARARRRAVAHHPLDRPGRRRRASISSFPSGGCSSATASRRAPRSCCKLAASSMPAQVRAVRHLVASAVEGLKPERVSIVDERGRLLADGAQGDRRPGGARRRGEAGRHRAAPARRRSRRSSPASSATAARACRSRPSSTSTASRAAPRPSIRKAASCARPRTRTENQVDDRQRRRGQRRQRTARRQRSQGAQRPHRATPRTRTRRSSITRSRARPAPRCSRAAGSSGSRSPCSSTASIPASADGELAYQPRPQEELDRIAALVRTAVGFDQNRGDQVEVVNLRFAEAPPPSPMSPRRR